MIGSLLPGRRGGWRGGEVLHAPLSAMVKANDGRMASSWWLSRRAERSRRCGPWRSDRVIGTDISIVSGLAKRRRGDYHRRDAPQVGQRVEVLK